MASTLKKGYDHIGVAIVYICHDGQGQFVMNKRGPNARDEQSRWDCGGGGLEFGETVEDCLHKEIKEEYGADVLKAEFLGYRDVHRIHDGQPTHWIALDFKVLVDRSQVKNNEPHKFDEIGWFTLNHLPTDVHSQFPVFLKNYQHQLQSIHK